MTGLTLDRYRIIEALGAGGMGVVYRAHDERLERDVALKVLPPGVAATSQDRARFHREAHALAALNHPNIAAIHGIEETDSSLALVMELVEGPTLADRLLKGALPAREGLLIAKQVADALECAHENGIVHRDLKPGNIKLKEDGTVKVLDFGLAKFLEPEDAAIGAKSTSTTKSDVTSQPGTVLGTIGYMSPEQARGSKVDRRTDIWAFGVVVYEMLSGRRAFAGQSSPDVIAAIMKEDPDWGSLPMDTPPAILRLLHRCLTKERRSRLHSIADARLEIEEVLTGALPAKGNVAATGSRPTLRLTDWLLWALLAAAMIAVVLVWLFQTPPDSGLRKSARFSINLPSEAPLAPASAMPLAVGRGSLALAPDGTNLVYVAFVNGKTKLYVRDMNRGDFRPLPGTEGAHSPFFSPDGLWVGFFANDKLKKVSLNGDQPVVLCDATLGFGGSWGPDGNIYFSTDYASGIYRIAAAGGLPETVADAKSGFTPIFFPHILPANRGVLYNHQFRGLGVYDWQTRKATIIQNHGTSPQYAPTGHILFARRNTLQAVPFDLQHLKITGLPVLLVDGVRAERDGAAQFTVSQDGTLVYAPGADGTVGSLTWVDRSTGKKRALNAPAGDYDAFRISPDGKRVAIPIRGEAGADIWLYDIPRGVTARFTADHRSTLPTWSPDGKFLYYRSWHGKAPTIFAKPVDGTGEEQLLIGAEDLAYPQSVSPDGQWLLYTTLSPETKEDLWLLRLHEGSEPAQQPAEHFPFLTTGFSETLAAISPDGHWVAYTSDMTGGWEVYVCAFPHPGESIRISTSGGEEPLWSHNGRELFYRFGTKWYAVDITPGEHFAAGKPRLLFEGPFANIPGLSYDVAPDGRHFLVVEGADQTKTTPELNVVTNLLDELRRRTSTK